MPSVRIVIDSGAEAAPLRKLVGLVTDRRALHTAMGNRIQDLTSRHILEVAAPRRHTTARRLGAEVTNYLAIAGQSVESAGDNDGATVAITRNGAIFARVAGPVTITARLKKFLTIPAIAAAYGRRAREVGGLWVRGMGKGRLALVRGPKYAKKPDGTRRTAQEAAEYRRYLAANTTVFYWLRRSVRLSEDRGLLPTEAQLYEAMKAGAQEALKFQIDSLKTGGPQAV